MRAGEPSRGPVEALGASAIAACGYAGGLAVLLAQSAGWAARGVFQPGVRFGRATVAAQIVRVGVRSLGIVALVQGFVGVILALQLTPPLREPWHQEQQVAAIIGVAGFRMLGPILTAVLLSGFAGASIAAELGTMVVAEEIEAMETMALPPSRYLVMPRVLATTVMCVLLSVVGDLMIAFGGWVAARAVLGRSVYVGYWDRMREQLRYSGYSDFFTGLLMAAVFGVLISLIACREGLSTCGGAEGVGRATTMTVVRSIVAIVVAACAFTMVFYTFGW